MKQILALEDFENCEAKETAEVISELKDYQAMIKELQLREKSLKSELNNRLKENGNVYIDEDYIVELKVMNSKRIDTEAVKQFCIKKDMDLELFQKDSVSERLSIKKK